MNRKLLFLSLVSVSFFLCSCVDYISHIHVKKDGSGTITETVLMEKNAAQSILYLKRGFSENFSATQQKEQIDASPYWWSKEDIEKQTSLMGEGVTLTSLEPCETEKGNGYKAVFSFTDISKLRFRPKDHSRANNTHEQTEYRETNSQFLHADSVTFSFAKGNPLKLTINMPKTQPQPNSKADQPTSEDPMRNSLTTHMFGAMSHFFRGMRAKCILTVEGEIVETNSTYRDGNQITIMDVDFDKLFDDSETINKIMQNNAQRAYGKNFEILKTHPHVVYEPKDTVTIEFR